MSKYHPLNQYLCKRNEETVILKFKDMEEILGFTLPNSAYKYREWWANGGHSYSDNWLSAGYKVNNVKFGEQVEFAKIK